jgi:protein-S-isoprenylcysteine O-methyltransferase Ste14
MVKNKIRLKIISNWFTFNILSIMILLTQYVGCASVWMGIMSIPLISYIILFFQNPLILQLDLRFFLGFHGAYIAYFGLGFYFYCLIYKFSHRNKLIKTGPYRLIRHPQYLAFIIFTFGLTSISLQTSPITDLFIPLEFDNYFMINGYLLIFYIWIVEVLAYAFLAKVEEHALKTKYSDEYLEYANKVGFMIPKFFSTN